MAIKTKSIADGAVTPYKTSDGIRKHRYFYERFNEAQPHILRSASSIMALPTASQGQTDYIITPRGNYMEYFQTTAQTLQPVGNAKGLVLDGDQVDDESAEYVPGGLSDSSPFAFLTGTDDDFAIRATLEITDASGSDQLLIGFRKNEAFQVPTSFLTTGDGIYTDFVGIGFCATKADPNPVGVAYDQNNGGSTTVQAVSFTWADTKIHKLEIRIIGRKARYFINGVELGGSISKDALGVAITAQATRGGPAVTLDSGDYMVPFIFVRQDADLLNAVYLRELEIGFLKDMEADPDER